MPDDDDQAVLAEFIHLARVVGLDEYLTGVEAWYTTRLGSSASFAGSAAEEGSLPDQAQGPADADGFEQPEISLLLQWGLTEAFPGQWDPEWTEKEQLQEFLVSDLRWIIPGYDETARVVPGFNETEINWADLTVEEMMALYRVETSLEWAARAEHYEGFLPPEYDEMKAASDRATQLETLAGPIPLDDTEAYAAAFAGIAYVPDAEHERRHVERQLKLIYEQILGEESDHLATLSTTELKYELYYRLNYDVLPFVKSDEHDIQLRISDFKKDYLSEAGDIPEYALDRLQGTFRQPDVVGFLFIMGLTIAFEPVDYALAAVDVIQALSEGDTESAIGNFLLGATPFVSSKLDDLAQPVLNRFDNMLRISDESVEGAHQIWNLGARSSDDFYNDISRGLGKLEDQQQPVTEEGLEIIRQHLDSPYLDDALSDPANAEMLERLKKSLDEGTTIGGADLSFYLHEQAEFHIMQQVLDQKITLREMTESYSLEVIAFDYTDTIRQNDLLDVPLSQLPENIRNEVQYKYAHEKALDQYQVSRYSLYAPEVISRNPTHFSDRWFEFWDIRRQD